MTANCGLLQTPSGIIHTKLAYGRFDKDGAELRVFEATPRWALPVANNLAAALVAGVGRNPIIPTRLDEEIKEEREGNGPQRPPSG